MIEDLCEAPDPSGTDLKEVFAFYGLAARVAQHVEKGLVYLLSLLETDLPSITQETYDARLAELDARTLGPLLQRAKRVIAVAEADEVLLQEALGLRNRLIHHFFEYDAELETEAGRQRAIAQLRAAYTLFKQAERLVWRWYEPILQRHGLSPSDVERMRATQLASSLAGGERTDER